MSSTIALEIAYLVRLCEEATSLGSRPSSSATCPEVTMSLIGGQRSRT